MMLIAILVPLLIAVAARFLPLRMHPNAGVDQWFWKSYIDALRAERRFPPELPQFLLDERQWYPPLFPVLMARLPAAIFERHSSLFSMLLDLLRLLMLVLATQWLSGSSMAALLAGVAYALTPLLVTYNMQLNPRGLGALFLDALWLCVAGVLFADAPAWFWGGALLFGGLVFVTHKMTTQLLVFTAIAGGALALDVRLALLVPGSMLAALVISGGFYRRVLLAHADIIRFWYRNWSGSGAHPVMESPLYGEPGYESPGKFYRRGLRAWIRRLQFVIGFNPWMPALLLVVVVALVTGFTPSVLLWWVSAWLALTFAFAVLTTLVPALRCFGQGYLYGYNGSFPAALLLGLTWEPLGHTWYWRVVCGLAVLACLLALFAFFRALRNSRTMRVDTDLEAAVARLAELPSGVVMCLPQHWHDVVAYRARKPVLFGGHGYGFQQLTPVFPVLRAPIGELIQCHDVRYLLTFKAYLPEKFLRELPAATVELFGDYQIYQFQDGGVSS